MSKFGEGHMEAWIREGFKEAAQALQAFPGDIHPVEEPGLVGNPTQPLVSEQMGFGQDAHLEGASDRGVGRDSPAPEIEMGE